MLTTYLEYLEKAGIRPRLRDPLLHEPDHDRALLDRHHDPRTLTWHPGFPIVEHFDATAHIGSDHASASVAAVLAAMGSDLEGLLTVEIGCGTAALSILAARLGARVIACDVDAAALDLARTNALANEVSLDLRLGSLLEPIKDLDSVDLFVANLPHKPGSGDDGLPLAQAGGEDGDALWSEAITGMAARQTRGQKMLCYLHSLPHPRLLARLAEDYILEACSWKVRWIQDGEYGGFVDILKARADTGTTHLVRDGNRVGMIGITWLGTRK